MMNVQALNVAVRDGTQVTVEGGDICLPGETRIRAVQKAVWQDGQWTEVQE